MEDRDPLRSDSIESDATKYTSISQSPEPFGMRHRERVPLLMPTTPGGTGTTITGTMTSNGTDTDPPDTDTDF